MIRKVRKKMLIKSIYKISCKDISIPYTYIDTTNSFKDKKYDLKTNRIIDDKLCEIVKNNGGWENWEIVELEKVVGDEKKLLERLEYYNDVYKNNISEYTNYDIIDENIDYECNLCKYGSNRKGDYLKHLSSKKHKDKEQLQIIINEHIKEKEDNKKNNEIKNEVDILLTVMIKKVEIKVEEEKEIKNRKIKERKKENEKMKKMSMIGMGDNNNLNYKSHTNMMGLMSNIMENQDKMLKRIEENQDKMLKRTEENQKRTEEILDKQQEQLIEYKSQPKTINNTTNNMTINMYLNEKCGNAINIRDFVQNLTVTLEQLIYTKEHGLAKGITNILVDSFKDVDQTERPIHCTDDKRHSLQIKDETWKTNKEEPKLIEEFVTSMSNRHFGALQEWAEDHPGWLKQNNKDEDFYLDCIKKIGNPSWSTEKNNKAFLVEISKCTELKLDRKKFNK